jgi:hypothetical protein
MADILYLSYWLRGYTENNMFRHFERLLSRFPFSTQTGGSGSLRITAVSFQEPPLIERSFEQGMSVGAICDLARQFANADCAYEVTAWWDLWEFDGAWKLRPCEVGLICFGPDFSRDDQEHLRIDFGLDLRFLPQPEHPDHTARVHSNIQGLLRLVHELDDAMPVERRLLWTESGENFADRLCSALE